MPQKPANLVYGVDEKPPLRIIAALALQHIFFLTAGLIVTTMITKAVGCSAELVPKCGLHVNGRRGRRHYPPGFKSRPRRKRLSLHGGH